MSPTEWLRQALETGSMAAIPLALVGGFVMGMNPCCLALYPAAAATCCAGACEAPQARMPLSRASLFVLGTATATTILGVVAALAGQVMGGLGGWARYLVAVVPLVLGAHLVGLIRLPMPKAFGGAARRGLLGAFVGGLLLSLVLSPCGTPALGAILSYAAYKGSIAYGGLLLFAYGIGNGLPLLAVGASAGGLLQRLGRPSWRAWVDRASGAMLVLLGVYLLFRAG